MCHRKRCVRKKVQNGRPGNAFVFNGPQLGFQIPELFVEYELHWPGHDIFGMGTFDRPWKPGQPCTQELADLKLVNAFDFFERLGAPFFCFHDVDAMAAAETPAEHKRNLVVIADGMAEQMQRTGTKLLWGTANLFSHPRYAAGAATSPDPEIYAWAAFQVREMLDGACYVRDDDVRQPSLGKAFRAPKILDERLAPACALPGGADSDSAIGAAPGTRGARPAGCR